MKILRYLFVVVLSAISGGIICYIVTKTANDYGYIKLSGGFMSGSSPDKTLDLLIAGFIGMIIGFIISLVALFLIEIFPTLNNAKLFFISLGFGLIIPLLWVVMAIINYSQDGGIRNMRGEDQKNMLIAVIMLFIIGFSTGLASVQLAKLLIMNQGSDRETS